MAAVQYRDQVNNVEVTRRIPAPKEASLKAWYKQARKFVPEIPHVGRGSDWRWASATADRAWIRFHVVDPRGNRVYVVIDRTQPSM